MLLFSKAIRQVKPKLDICFNKSIFYRNNTIKNIGVLVVLKYKKCQVMYNTSEYGDKQKLVSI